jgi:hypothetical protein
LEDADIFGAKGVVLIHYLQGNGIKMRELDLITDAVFRRKHKQIAK